MGIVEPPAAVPVFARQPLATEDRNQHVAGTDGALKDLHEVDACFDVGDVHEHRRFAEPCPQVVEQPAGMAGTVLTPVADEETWRRSSSQRTLRQVSAPEMPSVSSKYDATGYAALASAVRERFRPPVCGRQVT